LLLEFLDAAVLELVVAEAAVGEGADRHLW